MLYIASTQSVYICEFKCCCVVEPLCCLSLRVYHSCNESVRMIGDCWNSRVGAHVIYCMLVCLCCLSLSLCLKHFT